MNDSVIRRRAFKRPARRRPACDYSAACRSCRIDDIRTFFRDREKFAVHYVVFNALRLDGAERSESDVEHYRRNFHAHGTDFFKKLLREMQSRRRSRRRAGLICVDGLIVVVVFQFFGYIRRERHFADFVKYGKQRFPARAVIVKCNYSVSVLNYFVDCRRQNSVSEGNLCALAKSSARTNKHFPTVKRPLTQQQKFAGCAALTEFFSVNSCRNDF